jgi:ADP-heptose:LPS heptosyltransferase
MDRALLITGEGLGNIIQSTAAISLFREIFRGEMALDVLVYRRPGFAPLVEGDYRTLTEPTGEKYNYIIPIWLFREYALRMKIVRRGRTNVIPGCNPLNHGISESEAHVRAVRAVAALQGVNTDPAFVLRTWCNYEISEETEALLDRQRPLICLHDGGKPGRFWLAKRYPHWQKVRDLVTEAVPGATFFVLGTMSDGFISGDNVVDVRERLSLLNVAGLLRRADLFIGNDSGLAHISAAQGTRTLVTFGPTNITKNLPPQNAIPVTETVGLACRPCQRIGGRWRIGVDGKRCHRECLVDLPAEIVANRILDSLKSENESDSETQ